MVKQNPMINIGLKRLQYICCQSLYHSLSFIVTRCTTRCYSLSFFVIRFTTRCHLLLFVVTRCTTRCHSLLPVVPFVATCCHSLLLVLPLAVTRCHSLSLVVTLCHSLSLVVPLVCLFINDQINLISLQFFLNCSSTVSRLYCFKSIKHLVALYFMNHDAGQ